MTNIYKYECPNCGAFWESCYDTVAHTSTDYWGFQCTVKEAETCPRCNTHAECTQRFENAEPD